MSPIPDRRSGCWMPCPALGRVSLHMPFSLTAFLPKVLSKVKGVNVDPLLVAALNWICLWRSDPSKTASVTDVTESATQPDLSSSPRVSQPSRLRLDVISRAVISRKFSGEAGSPLQGLEPFKVLPAHVEDFFLWQNKMSDLVANMFRPRPADCGSFLSWIWGRFSPFLNSKTSEPLALSNRTLLFFIEVTSVAQELEIHVLSTDPSCMQFYQMTFPFCLSTVGFLLSQMKNRCSRAH